MRHAKLVVPALALTLWCAQGCSPSSPASDTDTATATAIPAAPPSAPSASSTSEVKPGSGRAPVFRTPAQKTAPLAFSWRLADTTRAVQEHDPHSVSASDGATFRLLFSTNPEEIRVVRRAPDGAEDWNHALGRAFVPGASIALSDEQVIVVTFSRIASGATATGLSRKTGAVLWQKPLRGMGPVDHSKYRNDVQVRVEGTRAIFSGRESNGMYVEARDVRTGAMLGHREVSLHERETIGLVRAFVHPDTAGLVQFGWYTDTPGSLKLPALGPMFTSDEAQHLGEHVLLERGELRFVAGSTGGATEVVAQDAGSAQVVWHQRLTHVPAFSGDTARLTVFLGHLIVHTRHQASRAAKQGREAVRDEHFVVLDPKTGAVRATLALHAAAR